MGSNRRFRSWCFTGALLAPLLLLAWTSAGNAGADKGKDCITCHKMKPGAAGVNRKVSAPVPAGVASPHPKRSSADPAKGVKGTDNTAPSSPGGRTVPRSAPSGKQGVPAPGTTIKR